MSRLHSDEVPIDLALAQHLIAEQHPQYAGRPLRRLSTQGTDNMVFRLGGDLALRLPRKASSVPGLDTEWEWLPRLAPHLPLSVPEPVARGEPTAEYPFPWTICLWVPGHAPRDPSDLDPRDTAERLGNFVRSLQAVDTGGAPVADEQTQRGGSLAAFHDATRAALGEVVALIAAGRVERELFDPGAARDLWDAAVAEPAWSGDGVWLHRDLYLDNLLAVDARLSGVIDFGGLMVGDPAGNAMAAWHVLPAEQRATFLRIVGAGSATQLRARGWVLMQGLLALPYYLDFHEGMIRMARRALRAALEEPVPTDL